LSNEYANSEKEKIIEKEELSRCKAGSNRQDSAPDVSILTLAYIPFNPASVRSPCGLACENYDGTTLARGTADHRENFRRRFP